MRWLSMGKVISNMVRGAAGLLDLFTGAACEIEFFVKPCRDDFRAIASDWQAVGKDIANASGKPTPRSESDHGHSQEGR